MALAIQEQALGPEHPNTQTVRKNYAVLLKTMERDKSWTPKTKEQDGQNDRSARPQQAKGRNAIMYVESPSEARTILTPIFTIQGMLKKAYQRRFRPCAVLTY